MGNQKIEELMRAKLITWKAAYEYIFELDSIPPEDIPVEDYHLASIISRLHEIDREQFGLHMQIYEKINNKKEK